MMNMKQNNWLKKLLPGCILSILTVTIILLCGDIGKVYDTAQQIKSNCLIWAGIFAICIYVGRYLKWNFFLRALKIKLPMAKTIPIFFACLSMGLTPGKVGEVLKSYLLDKLYGIDFVSTAPTILAERVTGTLGCLVLCIISLCFLGEGEYQKILVSAIALLILLAVALYVGKNYFLSWGFGKLKKIKYMAKWQEKVKSFYESSVKLLGWKIICIGVCISCLYWMMECMVFYTLLQGVGVHIGVMAAILILTSVSIGGGLTMSPGSIGAVEGGLLGILMYQGMSLEVASCVVFLHRGYTMWSVVVLGSVLLVKKYYKAICEIN